MPVKTAIIPGNGAGDVRRCSWYPWLQQKLHHPPAVSCTLRNMPDPITARECIWLPFMRNEIGCDENTIIIGHSSGAVAAMRFAEKYKVAGVVLVSSYTTDQGDETEAASGYFNRPWQWQLIKENAGFVIQFASEDDPFLPMSEQLEVAEGLSADLHRFTDRGHFQDNRVPELYEAIHTRIQRLLKDSSS